ncbi:MAG: nucleotidyl transferase AbiEii/AbiGii toxin family protein [Acidaminococcaceae bacterium]|nr:nucleotidyl transferase AbiEii/AbiGii toxin family protein [Acidaminococcaceae bacterium]
MKNSMQLKALVKNIAKDKKISAQLVLQNYMLERFLERVAKSPFKDNFIIKGGFLIASMVGINARATMDMDATIKNYPVNASTIRTMIETIIMINLDDDITFKFKDLGEIREGDIYSGYRITLTGDYTPMSVPLKLDITTGDKITPREIEYEYKLMFEERSIQVLAYNLATILAEKIETVLSRGDQNTRPRDYYDIFILYKLRLDELDLSDLRMALESTDKRRGSWDVLQHFQDIINGVKDSNVMRRQWDNYQKDFDYAKGIDFNDVCDTVVMLMNKINN